MDTTDPVVIVGAGCKLPSGISSIDELAQALHEGRDCITEVPADRWDVDAFYDSDPLTPGRTYVRHGGFMSGVDEFDAGFSGTRGYIRAT